LLRLVGPPEKQCMMPPSPLGAQCSSQQRQRVLPGFARMNHDRLARIASDAHLVDEDLSVVSRGEKS
jgi:hypothetical protein